METRFHQSPLRLPKEQLLSFVQALFEPTDIVELRAVQRWLEGGKTQSRLVDRRWLTAQELISHYDSLRAVNDAGAHVYFGVNPRSRAQGTKEAVLLARSVWADFDEPDREQVLARIRSVLPKPSILVHSGHGFHAYWLLQEPYLFSGPAKREKLEAMLKRLYQALGSDSTQDATRLLRLPGFQNPKGTMSAHCTLLECDISRRSDLSLFDPWMHDEEQVKERRELCAASFPKSRDSQRIAGLVRYLERDVRDRSRRDYGVLAGILRLDPSLSAPALWQLVRGRSKFTADRAGERYFETTLKNVQKALR